VDREQIVKINSAIEEQLEDVLLSAYFNGKKDKSDREIAPDHYGLRFDYEVPSL
jgi:hypothetical protein